MHWGIDAQRLAGQRLGVGRYIEYLLREWDRCANGDDQVTLFVRDPLAGGDATLGLSPRFAVRHLRPRLTGQLWQNVVLPRHARHLDVLFCPSYSMPLGFDRPCVVAIHSVNEVEDGTHPWWYNLTYSQVYRLSARRADRVIVPSESTSRDLQALYGVPAEKIDVVPQGADEVFQPITDSRRLAEIRRELVGADVPYVVFVGKLSQRRNIPALLEAFAILKRRTRAPHKLLLFGPNHLELPIARIAAKLAVGDSVVQTDGRVANHADLVPVYGAADLYVNASLYEGFSMTLVEALSCGTPVVGVRRGAVQEIADGCAVLVDEPEPQALASAMERVLTDDALRADLRQRSVQRAAAFRWDKTARQTLDVLRRVVVQS